MIPYAELGHSEAPSQDLRSAVLAKFSLIRRLAVFLRTDEELPYWLPSLYSELPCMQEIIVVGERGESEGYAILSHRHDIFYNPSLTSLTLYCIVMDWDHWLPPPTLYQFAIAYRRDLTDDGVPPPPDYDPTHVVPSLDRLTTMLTVGQHLTKLTLSGCFEYHGHSPTTLHDRPEVRLAALRELTLAGDGASIDVLCRCLVMPAIHLLTINSSDWRNIHSLRLLTRQLRLTSSTSTVVAHMYIGGQAGIARPDSIYVDWMEMPTRRRLARTEACQLFSDWACSNWANLFVQVAFDPLEKVVIYDRRSRHSLPRSPVSTAEEWAVVCRAHPHVRRVILLDGVAWSVPWLEALRNGSLWPEMHQVQVHLPNTTPVEEKEAFGDWGRAFLRSGRDIAIQLNQLPLNFDTVRNFVATLPPHSINRHYSWIMPPSP